MQVTDCSWRPVWVKARRCIRQRDQDRMCSGPDGAGADEADEHSADLLLPRHDE